VIQKYSPDEPCEILTQAVSREELSIPSNSSFQLPCAEANLIQEFHQGQILALEDIAQSNLSPRLMASLGQLGVRSLIMAPILLPIESESTRLTSKLWGFLLVHECAQPREWQSTDVDLIQQIVTQLGIAIYQSELYQQLQTELQERTRAEAEVRSLNAELEQRVAERTQTLQIINRELEEEIRQRIRTTKALRESEKRFRDLIETTNDLVWEEDANGVFTYVSPQSQEILGYEPDELIGKRCFDVMASECHQQLKNSYGVITVHEPRVIHELTAIHKNGHPVVLESNAVAQFDENGQHLGARGIDRDITARKKAEEQLRRYERIVSATNDGISLIDRNYTYQIVNQAYLERFDKSLNDIIGHSVRDLFDEELCQQTLMPQLDRCFEGESVQYELWFDFPNHGRRYLSVNYSPYIEADGSISGAVVSSRDITDLKCTEEALKTSESKLQDIINSAGAAIGYGRLYSDRSMVQVFNSIGCLAITGFSPEDLNVQSWASRVYPGDRYISDDSLLDALYNEQSVNLEYRFFHKDGSIRWLSDHWVSRWDDDAQCWMITGVAVDVTERKQAELALRESERQLQQIFDNIEDIFFLKESKSGDLIYQSSSWDKLFQQPTALPYDNPDAWLEFIHSDDRDRVSAIAQQQPQGSGFGDIEYRIVLPDGSIRWVWNRTFPIRNESGEIYRFAGINTDITERKQAEAALQASEAKNRALINALPDLVIRMSRDGIYLDFFSTDTFRVAGTRDLVGQPITEGSLPSTLVQQRMEAITQALETGKLQIYEQEMTINGDRQIEEVRVVACDDDSALLIVRDISDRKQAEAALQQSEARFQTLVTNMPGMVYRYHPGMAEAGAFIYVSSGSEDLFELTTEQVLQDANAVWSLIHPDDLESLQTSVAFAVEHCLHWEWEGQLTTASGQHKWIQGRSRPQPTPDGVVWDGILLDITDRKQAELALRDSEQRFQEIASTVSQLFLVRSAQTGEFIYVSPAYETIWGRSCESLYAAPTSWMDAIHPDDRHQINSSITEQFDGNSVTREYRIIRPDGEIRWIFAQLTAICNDAGEVDRFIGFAADISDRKQAEESLRISEERLRTLINTLPMGVWARDANDRLVLQNHIDRALYGNKLGTTPEELGLPPEILAKKEDLNRRCQQGETVSYETHDLINGKEYSFLRIMTALPDQQGDVGLLGVVVDITQQKQVELALRNSEQRYATLVESSPMGIFRFNASGQCVYVNPRWCEMTGRSANEAYGDGWQNALHPDDFDISAWHQATEQPSTLRSQGRHLLSDGTIRWVDIHMVPEFDASGEFTGFIGTVSDITERKQAEDALRSSESRLKTLVDSLPFAVWVRDWEDRLIVQNPVDIALYGNKLGTHIEELGITQELLARYDDVKRRCQTGEVVSVETTELINGEERTFHRLVTVLPEGDGRLGTLGVAIDVTEQRRIQQALQISEERLRRVIDALPLGVWMRDSSDRVILQNQEDMARYGNLLGTDYSKDDLPSFLNNRYEDLKHRCLTGEIVRYETTERIDGEEYTFLRVETGLPDFDGNPGIFGASIDITDRKRSEKAIREATEALIESEARQRLILEAIPDLLNLFSADGTLLDTIRTIPGKNLIPDPERVIGKNLLELIPHDLAIRQIQGIQTALATETIQVYEQHISSNAFPQDANAPRESSTALVPSDMHHEEVRIVPTSNNQALILIRDITDRVRLQDEHQQAVQALATSEQRQRAILQAIPELIGWFSQDGTILDWYGNSTIRDLIPSDINPTGRSYREFVPPDIASRLTAAIQQAIHTNTEQRYEQQVEFDDTIQHEEVIVVPTGNNEALMVVRNISDRKALENHLKDTQQTLRDILDHVDASIIRMHVCDSGDITTAFISAGCETVFGYTSEELMGDRSLWRSRVNPDDLETIVKPSQQRVCEEGQDSITYRFHHKDEEVRHIHSRAIAHRDESTNCWVITAIETLSTP
jgi:PAS domain S-box-containing protein